MLLVSLTAALAAAFVPASADADSARDIIQEIDENAVDDHAIQNRLDRVNVILAKASNRLAAVDDVYAAGPCIPVVTHVGEQPACTGHIAALDLVHAQTHSLALSVAAIDDGSDPVSVARRLDRAVASHDAAVVELGGIIGPERAGIIGPEIPAIIGPEMPNIAGELTAMTDLLVSGIIGPEMPGIIGPERTAPLVDIIGPEIGGIIGPEREAALADAEAEIARLERQLVLTVALRDALAAP